MDETNKKKVLFPQLSHFLDRCKEIFASKEIESTATNVAISKETPGTQKIGDVWFVKTSRE